MLNAQPKQIHELKITLHESKPPIWRQVAVPSNIRLSDLHYVIQIVMGWTNTHLHQFVVQDYYFSDPRMELEDAEDERKVILSELAPTVKSKFIYEYDFGDGWDHQIEVVKISPPDEGTKYPVCLKGKLACPPEDCGGIWGYYDMLEAVKDPKHPEHEDYLDWLGDNFNPERFDLEQVNKELAQLRSGKSRRLWDPY